MLKFSVIMETIGYLFLDFNKKPKKLDRLVAYIAMVHKDMQLDEEDLNVCRFFLFLLLFLRIFYKYRIYICYWVLSSKVCFLSSSHSISVIQNFMSALIEYLLRTCPMHMTTQCQEAMSKFTNSVVHELIAKMRLFRDYDVTLSNEVIRSVNWLIFNSNWTKLRVHTYIK